MRPGHHGQPVPDHARAARAYFWEGKPFKHALIEAGYSGAVLSHRGRGFPRGQAERY